MKQIILLTIMLLLSAQSFATEFKHNPKLDGLFEQYEMNGTFVLYDVELDQYTAYNSKRAEQRFIPASTYKIPNSLIGLSVGAVKDVDEILPYGGKPQPFKTWEKDMGLREAIAISNVPIFQELARRIGLEQMQKNVSLLNYGNCQIGNTVDTFWLDGPLKISAIEQTKFLAHLAQGKLSLSQDIQASVREIVKIEENDDWILYGKTGWVMATEPNIGWWVGFVESKDKIYSFALNLDIHNKKDAAKRIELGKACLKTLGVIK